MELVAISWRILISWPIPISHIHIWVARVGRDSKVGGSFKIRPQLSLQTNIFPGTVDREASECCCVSANWLMWAEEGHRHGL